MYCEKTPTTTPHVDTLPVQLRQAFAELRQKYPCPFFWELDHGETLRSKVRQKAETWLHDEPRNTALHNVIGYIAYSDPPHGAAAKAKEKFEYVLQIQPDNLIALTSLVYVCRCEGDEATAEQWLRKLTSLPKHDEERRKSQARFEKGFIYFRFGEKYYERAENLLRLAVSDEPESQERLKSLIQVMTRRLDRTRVSGYTIKYEDAPEYVRELVGYSLRLIDLNPAEGLYYALRGEILQRANSYNNCKEAIREFFGKHPDETIEKSYEEAYRLAPEDIYVCEKLAHHYRKKGQYGKASAVYKDIIRRFPNKSSAAHQSIGISALVCYEKRGGEADLEEAIRELKVAVEIDRTNTNAMTRLGMALCAAEKYEESKAWFTRAIQIRDDPDDARDVAMIRYHFSICLLQMGEIDRGYEEMKGVLANEGRMNFSISKKYDKYFEDEKRKNPTDAWPVAHKAQKELLLGRPREALSLFRKANQLDPQNVYICLGIGKAYLQMNDRRNARQWLEASKSLGSDEATGLLCEIR
ncbi:interferon-induced protein with tetratricopeptide repeats 5-like [Ptychodera flava]|uniref:interferon-induced protein with tetratricopeptide repeats 5-like n=1 Tax=Ptychodera flava TaxID=63121 RepID=UPI00396A2717